MSHTKSRDERGHGGSRRGRENRTNNLPPRRASGRPRAHVRGAQAPRRGKTCYTLVFLDLYNEAGPEGQPSRRPSTLRALIARPSSAALRPAPRVECVLGSLLAWRRPDAPATSVSPNRRSPQSS